MYRYLATAVTVLIVLLAAAPLSAGTRLCNATLVSQNVCRVNSDALYSLSISTTDPDGAGPKQAPSVLLQDAFAALYGWSANMTCTPEMVTATICNSGQLGTPVAITKAQFADMLVRRYIMNELKRYREQQEHAVAQETVNTETPPDVGN